MQTVSRAWPESSMIVWPENQASVHLISGEIFRCFRRDHIAGHKCDQGFGWKPVQLCHRTGVMWSLLLVSIYINYTTRASAFMIRCNLLRFPADAVLHEWGCGDPTFEVVRLCPGHDYRLWPVLLSLPLSAALIASPLPFNSSACISSIPVVFLFFRSPCKPSEWAASLIWTGR